MATRIPLLSTSRFRLTVTRSGINGAWGSDGIYVPPTEITFTIICNAQPLNAKELLNLPEAQRTRESIKFYTWYRMNTASEFTLQEADVIAYDGRNFQIQQVMSYKGSHLFHDKAIALRLDAGT